MPNKFLVETALDVGIDNLKKLRNTDPKALYDEVKWALATESSPEIKALYERYIKLYDQSLRSTSAQSGALSEEIKWKNISDLKKAVDANGAGLTRSDMEWLNQFALAEYSRQNSRHENMPDTDILNLLNRWFRIYESTQPKKILDTKPLVPTISVVDSLKPQEAVAPTEKKQKTTPVAPENNILDTTTGWVAELPKKNTPVKPATKAIVSKNVVTKDALPEIFATKQTIVLKDGAYYLTWPKWNIKRVDMQSLLVNLNLPKDAPENLWKSVSLIQDFSLMLDAYLLKNPDKKEQYNATLKWVQNDFASIDIQSGKFIVDVKKWTYTLFSNNNLLKDSDLYKINQAMDIKESKARRFAILSFIRDRLGQSDLVAQKLMEDTMSKFWFPTDDMIVKNGDLSSTKLDIKQITKVREAIDKARSEANSNWMKNKVQYLDIFKQQNPGKTIDIEAARVANEKLTILMSAKREIVYQNLYNQKDLSPELSLLQNILWAGSTKMSDRSWEISKEVAAMIGMEAVAIGAGVLTMGAGTVAINALAFWVNATRGVRVLEAYNAASKTKQYLTTTARILGGGVAFEAGGATTRSLIENGDLTSMHSKEWYVQSIAMMGVMRGIGEVFTRTGILAFKEGAWFAKNILPFTGQVAIEGSAIFGTSAAIGSVVFDRRDNWTLEQMAQAMLMATIFKWAGRVFAGKSNNGDMEVRQVATPRTWVRVEADTSASTGKPKSQADFVVDSKGNITLNKANEAKTGTEKKATPESISDAKAIPPKKSTVPEGVASKNIDSTVAKNAIHKAEKATIDDAVSASEKQNFIAKYGSEKWDALAQSFKDAPKWIWNGAKSIFGVVTWIGRSSVSWKWATIWTGITEVIEAFFNLNGTERDWNPMSEDGIKNIWGMLWQILAYRYMGIARWFIVTEGYNVIPAVYTKVKEANK